jgi:hypothetical protein
MAGIASRRPGARAGAPPPEDTTMNLDDLDDPAFRAHVRQQFPDDQVRPDEQDYDRRAVPRSAREAGDLYREAQARKLMRMWEQWVARSS